MPYVHGSHHWWKKSVLNAIALQVYSNKLGDGRRLEQTYWHIRKKIRTACFVFVLHRATSVRD